jgi:hypothetical protein
MIASMNDRLYGMFTRSQAPSTPPWHLAIATREC